MLMSKCARCYWNEKCAEEYGECNGRGACSECGECGGGSLGSGGECGECGGGSLGSGSERDWRCGEREWCDDKYDGKYGRCDDERWACDGYTPVDVYDDDYVDDLIERGRREFYRSWFSEFFREEDW